mgnify:CR=1 FL=1
MDAVTHPPAPVNEPNLTYAPGSAERKELESEIDRLERAYTQHFNTLWNMLSKAKFTLTRRFFETVASRVMPTGRGRLVRVARRRGGRARPGPRGVA